MFKKNGFAPIIALLIILLVIGGIYLGLMRVKQNQTANPVYSPSPTAVDLSSVTKIIGNGKPQGFTATWTPFELNIPVGWHLLSRTEETPGVLGKEGGYQITIGYPLEGSVCNFPDTKPFEGQSGDFEIQSEFATEFGVVRLGKVILPAGTNIEEQFFRICQKEENSPYWAITLPVGAIYYQTPPNPDKNVINEMNNIVRSIKISKN